MTDSITIRINFSSLLNFRGYGNVARPSLVLLQYGQLLMSPLVNEVMLQVASLPLWNGSFHIMPITSARYPTFCRAQQFAAVSRILSGFRLFRVCFVCTFSIFFYCFARRADMEQVGLDRAPAVVLGGSGVVMESFVFCSRAVTVSCLFGQFYSIRAFLCTLFAVY